MSASEEAAPSPVPTATESQKPATPEPDKKAEENTQKQAVSTPEPDKKAEENTQKQAVSTPASGTSTPNAATPPPGKAAPSFKSQFRAFSKFGDTKSDGRHITLSQSDKWMKQAKVIDGKKITTTDTGIYFKKLKQQKLGMEDYNKFLEDLAKNKKVDVEEIKGKMAACGAPGLSGASTPGKAAAAVDRLTDVSKYTGAHKQRFDESGKGKGIAGRKDVVDSSGYVQGYQNKDSYSKNH